MKSIFRELELRLGTALYFVSSILVLALKSSVASFFLHWIATFLYFIHIIRYYTSYTPLSSLWRSVMMLSYGVVTSCFLSNITSTSSGLKNQISGKYAIGIIGIIVSIVTAVLLYLFPLPLLPDLTGRYKRIGTHSFHVNKSRDMFVQCWFPLNKNPISLWQRLLYGPRTATMWTSGHPKYELIEASHLYEALGALNNLPNLIFKHMVMSKTHSEWCDDVDLSLHMSEKYPVAIYSHGLYGWRQIHHTACEQLASNGFIVFAIDHTPDATISRPHGRPHHSVRFDFEGPEDNGTYGPEYRQFYTRGLERRVNDIVELLDYLSVNQEYSSRLELDKVFVWGHSYGGGTTAALAAVDSRIAGIACWDSWMFPVPPNARKSGSKCPSLFLSSDIWEAGKYQGPIRDDYLQNSKTLFPRCNLIFKGSDHQNFCDVIHLTSRFLLTRPSSVGPTIDPGIAGEAMDRLLVAFFTGLAYSYNLVDTCSSIDTKVTSQPKGLMNPLPSYAGIQIVMRLKEAEDQLNKSRKIKSNILTPYWVSHLQSSLLDAQSKSDRYDHNFFDVMQASEKLS